MLYLGGQITSMAGDSSLWLAAGIWVKSLTGSSSAAAVVWLAFIVGGLTGPVTAVLVDRLPLRPLLVATNLAGALVVVVLLFVRGPDTVWLVYPVMFGYGVSYALLNAGTSAMATPMFGTDLLAGANGVLATAKQGMNLIAPLLGAGLFSVVGARPVIIADAATFVVAATTLSLVRVRTPRPEPTTRQRAVAVLGAGMRHLMGTPVLRRMVLAVSIAILGLGFLEPVEFSVNSDELHRTPAFMGLLFAFQGAGAVVGGVFAARAVGRFGEVRTAGIALTAAAAGIASMAVPVLPVVFVAFTVYGAALPWLVVAQQTQLQRTTPRNLQGRVAAAAGLLTKTPQACGIAVGAAVIGLLGYRTLLGFIALATCLAAVWLFAFRTARSAP